MSRSPMLARAVRLGLAILLVALFANAETAVPAPDLGLGYLAAPQGSTKSKASNKPIHVTSRASRPRPKPLQQWQYGAVQRLLQKPTVRIGPRLARHGGRLAQKVSPNRRAQRPTAAEAARNRTRGGVNVTAEYGPMPTLRTGSSGSHPSTPRQTNHYQALTLSPRADGGYGFLPVTADHAAQRPGYRLPPQPPAQYARGGISRSGSASSGRSSSSNQYQSLTLVPPLSAGGKTGALPIPATSGHHASGRSPATGSPPSSPHGIPERRASSSSSSMRLTNNYDVTPHELLKLPSAALAPEILRNMMRYGGLPGSQYATAQRPTERAPAPPTETPPTLIPRPPAPPVIRERGAPNVGRFQVTRLPRGY